MNEKVEICDYVGLTPLETPKGFGTRFFLVLIIFANIACSACIIQTRYFNPDEFQHTHIMWNIVNGKVIYRDFFEHHGPLYPLLNSVLYQLFNLRPAIETFFWFRVQSIVWMSGILGLTFCIARLLTGSVFFGLVAACLLSSLSLFTNPAMEIRPDGLQNAFSLLGLYLFLVHRVRANPKMLFLSGASFGVSIMANAKAAMLVLAVASFMALDGCIQKRLRALLLNGGVFAGGVIVACAPILGYFLWHRALSSYFFYNFIFNRIAYLDPTAPALLDEAVFTSQLFLHLLLTVGLCGFFFAAVKLSYLKTYDGVTLLLVLLLLQVTGLFFLHFWWQIYVSILPILCIVAGLGLFRLSEQLRLRFAKPAWRLAGALLFLAIFSQGLFHRLHSVFPPRRDRLMQQQLDEITYMLNHTERSEPVLLIWCNGGGYTFNEDTQYYWLSFFYNIYRLVEHRDIWGRALVEQLEKEHVRYIVIARGASGEKQTTDEIRTYIRSHFAETEFEHLRKRVEP